jgi:metal-responsive CopG/Arc/MetJ family transcriptional regulator
MKKSRIEIHLDQKDVKVLDKIAKGEGRSRKNYCEEEIKKKITEYTNKPLSTKPAISKVGE